MPARRIQSIGAVWLTLVLASWLVGAAPADDDEYYEPGITAADLLRRRGFLAEELFLTTSSGYVLRLTRGLNPALANGHLSARAPVLFVHGTKATANIFLLNSFGAKPKDFTQLDFSSMDSDELVELLADEPSSWSLPLLASNCGHEIWFVDRRGRPGSQELVGESLSIKATPREGLPGRTPFESMINFVSNFFSAPLLSQQVAFAADRKFWNFSMDEQARDDLPQVIDFIRDRWPQPRRVALVGHSAGAALPLMALSLYPDELSRKLARVILWSASFARGNGRPDRSPPAPPIGATQPEPKPAPYQTSPYQATQMLICAPRANWDTICESAKDAELGDSGRAQPMRPQFWAGFEYATAARELAQLNQSKRYPPGHLMHFFDFGPEANQLAYGQSTPPAYNLTVVSNFTLISLYAAATDTLATPADIEKIREQLRVPHEYHLINTTFNHIGYFFHRLANRLAVIPSMHEIGTSCMD